jgi:N-acetylmuramoyl-L-alanine amidase
MKGRFLTGLALAGLLIPPALADSAERLYERGRAAYFAARKIPDPTARKAALRRAEGELRKFVESSEGHAKATDALFNLGSLHADLAYLDGDREAAGRAVHYFRDLVRRAPRDRLADDALAAVADLCEKVYEDLRCASEERARIRSEYAGGDMASRVPAPARSPLPTPPEGGTLGAPIVERGEGGFVLRFPVNGSPAASAKSLPARLGEDLPARYYVDVEEMKLAVTSPIAFPEADPVSQVRFGQNGAGARIVLDLRPAVDPSRVSSGVEAGELWVRVASPAARSPAAVATQTPPPILEAAPAAIQKTQFRIVVDAGHGGEDSGARGRRGTEEKTICLAIAKRVEELLKARSDYEVFMTRRDDRFVPLAERTRFANRVNGDLFVSIHTNAAPRKSAEGVSTYFLDNHDDAESLRVALRENFEPNVIKSPATQEAEDQYLEIMKASMVKNFHTVQSTEFARKVQQAMVQSLRKGFSGVADLGVKSARFYVLTGAEMPAILVETSFISNAREEKRLADPKYQRSLAEAIVRGIDQFFKSSVGRGDHAALYQR